MAKDVKIGQIMYFMVSITIIIVSLRFFSDSKYFLPLIAVALMIAASKFIVDYFAEKKRQQNIENAFPGFVTDLVGAVKSGMTVPAAIVYISKTDYGALTPYVTKMANQLSWSFPVHKVLFIFARDTNNKIIKRSIATVIEAEQSGGNIEDVLESITQSLLDIKKIKEERKASIHSQTIQSYMIFIVFLGVMVVISNFLIPFMSNVGDDGDSSMPMMTQEAVSGLITDVKIDTSNPITFFQTLGQWFLSVDGIFLCLSLIQALFAGLVIGKLAEGNLQSGFKHSLILGLLAFFIITLF